MAVLAKNVDKFTFAQAKMAIFVYKVVDSVEKFAYLCICKHLSENLQNVYDCLIKAT